MIIMYLWSQLDRNDYTLFWGSRSTLYFHHCRRRETSNFRKRSAWEHTCLPWVNSDTVNKCIWRTIVTAVTDFMMHAVAWCLKSETAYVWKTTTTIRLLNQWTSSVYWLDWLSVQSVGLGWEQGGWVPGGRAFPPQPNRLDWQSIRLQTWCICSLREGNCFWVSFKWKKKQWIDLNSFRTIYTLCYMYLSNWPLPVLWFLWFYTQVRTVPKLW